MLPWIGFVAIMSGIADIWLGYAEMAVLSMRSK